MCLKDSGGGNCQGIQGDVVSKECNSLYFLSTDFFFALGTLLDGCIKNCLFVDVGHYMHKLQRSLLA